MVLQEEVKYSEGHLGAQDANTTQTRTYLAEVLAKQGNKVTPKPLLLEQVCMLVKSKLSWR